jgi:hypothetical protein
MSRRTKGILGGALGLLVVLGVVWALSRRGPEKPSPPAEQPGTKTKRNIWAEIEEEIGGRKPSLTATPEQCKRWEQEGASEAESDIKAGKLSLAVYGEPGPGREYAKLLEDRLGVSFTGPGGCCVTPRFSWTARGYNNRMEQEIERRFGPGALAKVRKEAEKTLPDEVAPKE